MDLYYILLSFFSLATYTAAEPFANNPGTVEVPYIHRTDYTVWRNIVATYQTIRTCTTLSCNYGLTYNCRPVRKSCPKIIPYDRCEITSNPGDMFLEDNLNVIKRACTTSECSNTCPGPSCLSVGSKVTVEVLCWSSEEEAAPNVTTTFKVLSVSNSSLTNCPLLTVSHGILSSADSRHCNTIEVSCVQGYYLNGESSLTCCNGTWSAAAPSCKKDCPSLTVPNGVVTYTDTDYGKLATVSCSDGFSLTEPPSLTCDQGQWNRQSPTCYADCKTLTIPHGKVTLKHTAHGTVTTILCDEGFSLSVAPSITCSNGSWGEELPACNKDCPILTLSNGKLSPNLNLHDSKVTVLCEEGYVLLGAPNLTCIDGNWSDYSPICLKECANNTFGENCTLFCDCITQNTIVPEQSCDPHSGLCRCLPSWEGERCDVNGTTCLGSPGGCMSEINNITSTPVSSSSKDSKKNYTVPTLLTIGIVFVFLTVLIVILGRKRMLKKWLSTAGDADEISYIDFGMPSEKDPRSRNTSERSMDSGYFETCWNNPLHVARPTLNESVDFPQVNNTEPACGVDWHHRNQLLETFSTPNNTEPGHEVDWHCKNELPETFSPPNNTGPGQEVDWDREDLTYL